MKPTNDWSYYEFYNMSQTLDRLGIQGKVDFRYLKDIVNTKISMFGYEGLPNGLTDEILESALCFKNRLCFYNSVSLGVVLAMYLPLGDYDIYWKPTTVDILSLSGKTLATNVPFKDIVLVRDNIMDIIPFIVLAEYCSKMVNIERTLEVNMDMLKLPAVFTGRKELVGSFNKIIQKMFKFEPIAIADKEMVESFKQYDVKLPIDPESLLELYKNYRNFALNSLGISGVETQKRERLLVGEVESQSEYINFIYKGIVNERERFIKECNEKFGTNIKLIKNYDAMIIEDTKTQAYREHELAKAQDVGTQGGNENV